MDDTSKFRIELDGITYDVVEVKGVKMLFVNGILVKTIIGGSKNG